MGGSPGTKGGGKASPSSGQWQARKSGRHPGGAFAQYSGSGWASGSGKPRKEWGQQEDWQLYPALDRDRWEIEGLQKSIEAGAKARWREGLEDGGAEACWDSTGTLYKKNQPFWVLWNWFYFYVLSLCQDVISQLNSFDYFYLQITLSSSSCSYAFIPMCKQGR